MARIGIHSFVWSASSAQSELERSLANTREAGFDLIEFSYLDPADVDIGGLAKRIADLGLGNGAARPRHRLLRAERLRRALEQQFGAGQIAELRHGDAAQSQRRRVVAQRDIIKRAERIAGGKAAGGGGDYRVQ